jgi:hypothetical protein
MALHLDRLDDATLEAASSPGLLRRARNDLASGNARVLRHEEHEVQVELEEARVTLGEGGLAGARCTCPAGDLCRHVLTAILLLRGDAPEEKGESPAQKDPDPVAEILAFTPAKLRKAFGAALLELAVQGLPGAEAVNITRVGAICVVRMQGCPEVRYTAGLGVAAMQVEAEAPRARELCAQALLAVRRAHQKPHPVRAGQRQTAAGLAALLATADTLVIEWARSGLAVAPAALAGRLLDGAIAARAAGLVRLASELRRLAEDVRRRRERISDLEPAASLRAAARTYALLEALRRHPDDLQLRGQARDRYKAAGALTLIGCGYEIWRTPAGARGVTGHFYEPARRRWLSASLARAAGQDPLFVPEEAVDREAVWGATLARLSVSEVSVRNAAISPAGRLSLSRSVRAELRPLTLRRQRIRAWEGSVADWDLLDVRARTRLGPHLRAAHRDTEVAVLLPVKIGSPVFDEVAQELVLSLQDRQGRVLPLRVPSQPHLERRLQALQASVATKPPEAFFVTLTLSGERLQVSPYALLLEADSVPWSLDALSTVERPAQGPPPELAPAAYPTRAQHPSTSIRLLTQALDALLGLCELGGQMHDPALLAKLRSLSLLLTEGGLALAAQLLDAVAAAHEAQRPRAVLIAAHALNGLAALLRLPPA